MIIEVLNLFGRRQILTPTVKGSLYPYVFQLFIINFSTNENTNQKERIMKKENLSIVITGASSGIGRATALEFAARGHRLALTARRKEALEEVVQKCKEAGGEAFSMPLDVSIEDDMYRFAERANQEYGGIDVWVNNAAVAMMGPFEDTPMKDIKRLIDINLFGHLYGARAALKYFRAQGHGVLINLSSIVGLTGQPYSIAYTTSKAAIRGMSLCLQQELIEENDIHVCTVLPATIDTPLFQSAANYMGREIKAMEPIVDAYEVAKEIVELVNNPKPEVIVGGMGIQGSIMKYFTPDLFAKMYNKQVKSKHFKEETADSKAGNLYDPKEGKGSVDGGWLNGEKSWALKAQPRDTMWLGAAVLGAVVGTAAFFLGNRR